MFGYSVFVFNFVFISKIVCLTKTNTVFGQAKIRRCVKVVTTCYKSTLVVRDRFVPSLMMFKCVAVSHLFVFFFRTQRLRVKR